MNQAPAVPAQPGASNQVVDNLWTIFAHNINSGACSYIEMPMNLKAVLGEEGLTIIALCFRNLIQAPVAIFEDPERAIIQIMPSRHERGHTEIIPGARDPKVKTGKNPKVARPANAFILYRQHHHPLLKSKHPDMHNNQISVILGKQWKKESESTKSRFINMAKQLKARHQAEHPDYQYQPRKPSEKKRRMTQRKKAALAEASHSQPSSSLEPTSEVIDLTNAEDGLAAPVPNFPETVGGNPMIELGGEDLDEQTLRAMLDQYNKGRPLINNQIANIVTQTSPPVVYAEASEGAQEQKNFYANFNPFSSNEHLQAEMEALIQEKEEFSHYDALDPEIIQAQFDEEQDYLFNAELKPDVPLER